MKYVIIQAALHKRGQKDVTVLIPVIFSGRLVHSEMAEAVKHNLYRDHDHNYDNMKTIGAGFVDTTNKGFVCYGRSESLNVASRGKQDSDVCNQHRYAQEGERVVQTVENVLQNFLGPESFMYSKLEMSEPADQLFEAVAKATKGALERRHLAPLGFVFTDPVRGYSLVTDCNLLLPRNLGCDYVGPVSTLRWNGVSHLVRLHGSKEVVEIPNDAMINLVPMFASVRQVLELQSAETVFNLSKTLAGSDVKVKRVIERLRNLQDVDASTVGECIVSGLQMSPEQQDGLIGNEVEAVGLIYVTELESGDEFVFIMPLGEFVRTVQP